MPGSQSILQVIMKQKIFKSSFKYAPVADMVENLPSSTAWATMFHYMDQKNSEFLFSFFFYF